MTDESLIPVERIQSRIVVLRDTRVVLDRDLATLYGVTTKRLLEQVRRNQQRFPKDFCFQLDRQELANLRSRIATSSGGHGGRRTLPWAFTEHGAIQAANVLNSDAAVEMSVHVVRAFIRLRQLMINHKVLAHKLAELDARLGEHDKQLVAIVDAIRQLTTPDASTHGRKMGFYQNS